MPLTYAQMHAQSRHHAGRNPREHGAPVTEEHPEDALESGNAAAQGGEVASTQEGGLAAGNKPVKESDIQHPEPAEHSDTDKSKLPDRGDENRKQAPNDRPGHKSGEGETPVG
jgi:hypothetical protein